MRESFESFEGMNVEITTAQNKNEYLDMELKLKEDMQIDHYPAFYVNKQKYTVILLRFYFTII